MSFKGNEGRRGEKRREKERSLDPSCSRRNVVVVNTTYMLLIDVRFASYKSSNLLQDNNNNECLCEENN